MILFSHFRNTANIGDLASGPYRYFDFPAHQVVDIRERVPACDALIFGGGAVGNRIARDRSPAAVRIAWGVGFTNHGQTAPGPVPAGFTLFGSREWGQAGATWVPCVSCMSPLFDRGYKATRDAVLYLNADPAIARKRPPTPDLPTLDNTAPLEAAIAFLASADTVVTDSYHGIYWATLLGRRAVCLNPYSSKFFGFKHPPAMGLAAMREARAWPEALAETRTATVAFHARVQETLCR